MPVYKHLDVNIAHIDESDVAILERYDPYMPSPKASVSAHLYQWGYDLGLDFYYRDTPEEIADRFEAIRNEGFSPFMANLIHYAKRCDCRRIRVDEDALLEPGLPIVHLDNIHTDETLPSLAGLESRHGVVFDPTQTAPLSANTDTDRLQHLFDAAANGDNTAAFALKELKRTEPTRYRELERTLYHPLASTPAAPAMA